MLIPRGKQRAFSAHSCIIRKPFSSGVAADERSGPQCVPAGQVCPLLYRPGLRALYPLCPGPYGAAGRAALCDRDLAADLPSPPAALDDPVCLSATETLGVPARQPVFAGRDMPAAGHIGRDGG